MKLKGEGQILNNFPHKKDIKKQIKGITNNQRQQNLTVNLQNWACYGWRGRWRDSGERMETLRWVYRWNITCIKLCYYKWCLHKVFKLKNIARLKKWEQVDEKACGGKGMSKRHQMMFLYDSTFHFVCKITIFPQSGKGKITTELLTSCQVVVFLTV